MYKYLIIYAVVFLIALCMTAVIEKRLIPVLRDKAKQPIYEGGPRWHTEKSGTPTMGGIAFLISVLVAQSVAVPFLISDGNTAGALSLLLALAYAILNSVIGIIDDATKLRRKRNAGLSPMQKIVLQSLLAAAFLFLRYSLFGDTTAISFSFGDVELGFLYYPMAFIILLGIVNCANLTDGIDGLASCVAFAVGISLFYISAYLSYETGIIAVSIIGASVGFLIFNLHPAKIFMGDTGSLFFGALAAGAVFSLSNPLLIIAIGGVYVIEGISVILQVSYYKLSGKRLFKMAPIHHHFERLGLSENTICIIAILLTFILSVPAYIFYLP